MEEHLVSVLMTAYNREKFIVEAIESVLASTYQNFELIITDDGSNDRTLEIARRYEQKDKRINVYKNPVNLGDYPNRNKAASYAIGKYIMFVDSDDTIFKNGMQECVAAMERSPTAGIGMYWPDSKGEPFLLNSNEAIRKHFFEKPFLVIGPGGTILRREFLKNLNGYPEKYGPANDMYFNLKAAAAADILMLPFEFVYYRIHEGQEINNTYKYLYNNYKYLRDAVAEIKLPLTDKQLKWISDKNKRRFSVNIVRYFLKTRDIKKTRFVLKETGFTFKDFLRGIFQ